MPVTTASIENQDWKVPSSAGKPEFRLNDAFVQLDLINLDRITDYNGLKKVSQLADFGMEHLNQDYSEFLKDPEFCLLINQADEVFDRDTLEEEARPYKHRQPNWEKRLRARAYRNKRTILLRLKREAEYRGSIILLKKKSAGAGIVKDCKKYTYITEQVNHEPFSEYMWYHQKPTIKPRPSETMLYFDIDGKRYECGQEVIQAIEKSLVYAIQNSTKVYIDLEGVGQLEVRDLVKAWI
jgi:hypothetical protein